MPCFSLSSKRSCPCSRVSQNGYCEKARKRKTLTATIAFFAALVAGLETGCTRAVLVPESSPVRIGPEVRCRIYLLENGEWVISDNEILLPEGWYCVPPSYVEEK
jgi:hypothetical protein